MMNNEEIIKLENVSFGYRKNKEIIKNADFSIYRGFVYGVVGKNSVGKSTLLKILCGKLNHYQGTITYCFEDIENYKSSIGIVTEEEEFMANLSLIQNVEIFGPLYKNFCMESFLSYMEIEKIDKNKLFSELSDSEKIKFRIFFALSYKPEILIMDEPAGVLDMGTREEFMKDIRFMATEQNITVIMATHLTADLDKMADYILFVNENGSTMLYDRESLSDNYMLLRGTKEQIKKLPQESIIAWEESENFVTAMTNQFLEIKEQAKMQAVATEIPNIETILYFMDKAENKYKNRMQKKEKNKIKNQVQKSKNRHRSCYKSLKQAYHRSFDISGRKWVSGINGCILLLIWNFILANTKNISDIKDYVRIICLVISYNVFFDFIRQPKNISRTSWYHILTWMPIDKRDILKLYLLNTVKCMGIGLFITLVFLLNFNNIEMLSFYAGFLIAYAGISVYEVVKLINGD